ncbi:MAG: xylulokinase [candidate division WOR-3 bacterium]|nr:xylulokinase [candidate division WOR-3 bacterium]
MKNLLLGIDIGTTGSKAILIDHTGEVIAQANHEYTIYIPKPNWSEQNPEDWWKATIKTIREVLKKSGIKSNQIAGIGLTGQMHGLVLLDNQKNVLRNCILWNDQRTAKECEEINKLIGEKRLIGIAGKPVLPSFTAGKILWVKKNEPEIYKKIAHILLPKDYVRFELTDNLGMDVNDASGTCLLDVAKRKWSNEIIEKLKIKKDWLPPIFESPIICGYVSRTSARLTGLTPGTPVVAGAGDQAAQAIGTGIYEPGIVSVTIGTSGVVFAAIDKYCYDKDGRLHTYCHATSDMWHLMGVMLSAGGSLRWLRDLLYKDEKIIAEKKGIDIYDLMTEEAEDTPPGADGLLFLPYLSGERTPHPDPYARGVFSGLSLKHSRPHLTRAVIEGVTFGLKDGLELLKKMGIKFTRVRVSGGGAKSRLWRQIMADVFDVDIVTVNTAQGAAYGAALLAGVGTGIYKNVKEACTKTIRETGITRPGIDTGIYQKYYNAYKALYPALKKHFRKLGNIGIMKRHV